MKALPLFIMLIIIFCSALSNGQGALEDRHYDKSLAYFNSGMTDEAIEEINIFIVANNSNPEGLMLRAFYYLQLDENEKALSDYNRVLQINKNNDDALANRALLFMEFGEYQNALTDINTRLENHPSDWSIYFDRAYCYGLNGDHNLAIKDFNESIRINPNHAESYANRGYSKINDLSNEGLIRPAPEQCIDACIDLRKALEMGDSTVVKTIGLYCLD